MVTGEELSSVLAILVFAYITIFLILFIENSKVCNLRGCEF
jgi:hypothetical protein